MLLHSITTKVRIKIIKYANITDLRAENCRKKYVTNIFFLKYHEIKSSIIFITKIHVKIKVNIFFLKTILKAFNFHFKNQN